ncbi:hypothetical protein [uncultured Eubacterium sp.]|uniref:hypothetical protein n=1 Tax=uncultured Eubacterium sp. TaxID=165185 RepID=UPI0025E77B73|nr:hypothetical protein [uncultured Eubacterium sp.]
MEKELICILLIFNRIGHFFENVSGIANFCTILLFVIFVIGKIWILFRNRNLYDENFEYRMIEASDEFNREFVLEVDAQEVIKISSPDGIYDIKIRHILERDEKTGNIAKSQLISKSREDNIQHPLRLNKNEDIYIRTDLPGGMPKYQIEITKYDYTKITAELCVNGKVGGFTLVNQKIKRGFRSWLYYLCQ